MHRFTEIYFVIIALIAIGCANCTWPVPYQRQSYRPKNDPYCQAAFTFCPTGMPNNTMPHFDADDVIDVLALKAPVWEFKFGSLLKRFNIMHDAIGFYSHKTGVNYTMEWYELNQLFNCTFPHVIGGNQLKWCNQGAACIYRGIDDIHWTQNGSMIKVAQMNGSQFDSFSKYTIWDNNTAIFYETWSVLNEPNGHYWFKSHDCATFVLNSFNKMAELGVQFNRAVQLRYTRINLYSHEPELLGNLTAIQLNQPKMYKKMIRFYKIFQSKQSLLKLVEHFIEAVGEIFLEKHFFFYYNSQYWMLPMKWPFVKLTYEIIPLP